MRAYIFESKTNSLLMTSMQDWLDAYGVSHKNSTNKAIHWICVPLIFISLIGLMSSIDLAFIGLDYCSYMHLGTLFLIFGLLFYLRLSVVMAIGMSLVSFSILFLVNWLNLRFMDSHLWIYLCTFALAWIGQFIGHKIEGAKPSFFDDLKFLLIGPGWLLSFILKKIGIKY
ncbi:MAG: DUF962 domain-containing protein [Flavobacteriales bacterium]